MSPELISRRQFVASTALAVAGISLGAAEIPESKSPFEIICFVKPFQNLSFDQIADVAAEVGWTGVEVPVRKDGTIEPERAEEELPKLVDALAKRKIELSTIATDIEDAADPMSRKLLTIAAKLGIPRYRVKHLRYDLKKAIPPQLEVFRSKFRGLAELNRELKLQGTVQNHSGGNYLGGPVWDIWELLRGLDPQDMAIYFDIGHATVEGGTSWPLQVKLMESQFGTISVKDFTWQKSTKPGNKWQTEWCSLGSGMIHPEFFTSLKKTNYRGPISQHFEYEVGAGKEMIAKMKRDFEELTKWIAS
jgi:sugar phosphate isomerase/epimerase